VTSLPLYEVCCFVEHVAATGLQVGVGIRLELVVIHGVVGNLSDLRVVLYRPVAGLRHAMGQAVRGH
jgi:hypothetical protein